MPVFVKEAENEIAFVDDVVGPVLVELLHELVMVIGPGTRDDIGHLPTIDLVQLVSKRLNCRLVNRRNLTNCIEVPSDLDNRVVLIEEGQRLVQTTGNCVVEVFVLPLVV
jgi:hypothetical protein